MVESIRQDVRHAVRGLVRTPVFALTAILSLAIGVGGTSAIYSLANTLLLGAPPGVGHPDRVVTVGRTQDGQGFDNFSYLNYADYRDRNTTFESLAATQFEPRPLSLAGPSGGQAIQGALVSGNFFRVLEARPSIGRFFLDEEDRTPRTHAVAVISHRLWRERFNGDSAIGGRNILLNAIPFTVVGVAAEGFHGPTVIAPDVWVPMMAAPWFGIPADLLTTNRSGVWLMAVGRLKPDVGITRAQTDLATIAAQLRTAYPESNEGQGVAVQPISPFPGELQRMVALFMLFLFVLAGLVLVIAGMNVAGMLLARAAARRREIAVRLAIGASRARLVRQLVTESAVLFLAAGAAGAVLSGWLVKALFALLPPLPFRLALAPSTDWRVVTFALLLSAVAGILTGFVPALQSTRQALAPELRSDVGGSHRRQRLRSGLLVTQMAFSMLLLVVAGLFGRALVRARAIDPGFDPRGVHVTTLDLRLANHTPESGTAFIDRLTQGALALPGVELVALTRMIPLDGGGFGLGSIEVDGHPAPDGGWNADWNIVSPEYFDVLRIPIRRGRAFTGQDGPGSADVAVINETLASAIWPGEDAVGKAFRNGDRTVTVIGIARNAKYRSLGDRQRGFVYVPFAQRYTNDVSLLVRAAGAASLAQLMQRLVAGLDPALPVLQARPLTDLVAIGLFPQRVAAWVAASLGSVALLLALIGIYGVTAYAVAQRTREIGIRIALGSTRGSVLRMVIGQGLRLGGLGVALGIAAALAATRLLESLLFGVPGSDPVALGVAGSLLLLTAIAATLIPARRAARVDPMRALRQE